LGVSTYSRGEDEDQLQKNNRRGDCVWWWMTSISGQDREGFGVTGMDERGRLEVQLSNGSGDVVAPRMTSARASNFWERDVEGPIIQGGTGNIRGGTRSGGVKD